MNVSHPILLTVSHPMLQILELLDSAVGRPSVSPAALLCQVEDLLLRSVAGATRVNALLVNRWFNKLFLFSAVNEKGGGRRGLDGGQKQQQRQQQQQQQRQASTFHTRAVCEIGEGVAGKAALTGRTLRVRGCSTTEGAAAPPREDAAQGSLLCWPVLDHNSSGSGSSSAAGPSDEARVILDEVEDSTGDGFDKSSRQQKRDRYEDALPQDCVVLAVLQVYCAEGELNPAAIDVLRDVGRLLVPLLKDALAQREEHVRRCEAEALYSLSQIAPRGMGLIAMVEEVVLAAEHLTEAERVCLFFVDDVANELWVAKSVDFDDAKVKIGQGLCGHAAATGEAVNVIDSYRDSRFDSSWDKQTGFLTKRYTVVL